MPANRFEVIECVAALEAAAARDLDGTPHPAAPLDVLCQHIFLTACAAPSNAKSLRQEVRRAGPYCHLTHADFDACLDFCATGGYALRAYDQWQRLILRDGLWQLRDPRAARLLRMNIGTIVNPELMQVRRRGNLARLGEVEESFAASLSPGDIFLIGGQPVRDDRLRDMMLEVKPQPSRQPKIAVFSGLKMATSTELSARVLALIGDPERWCTLPPHTGDGLTLQQKISALPETGTLTCESFERAGRAYFCLYGFCGRNAHQTLGLLITRRMEEAGLGPLGFVATDYALLIWSVYAVLDPSPLLRLENLTEGMDQRLSSNALMKRSFRAIVTIAGLLHRNLIGTRKSGKQATFSSDILYDTFLKYDPKQLLLRITRAAARHGIVDFERIEMMLAARPEINHTTPPQVTPLAARLLLEAGKVPIRGLGAERLLEAEAARMMAKAGLA